MTSPAADSSHAAAVRSAGLRVTPGRLAILDALDHRAHASAETLRVSTGGILSIQSVHNVLADLSGVGLVRRIEPAGSAALYELRIGDNHHHVVCTGCGTVADVDCVHGSAPCLTPGDTAGFVIDAAEVTFWGLCPACQGSAETK